VGVQGGVTLLTVLLLLALCALLLWRPRR